MRPGRGQALLLCAVTAALTGACANQGAPPGGVQDTRPPVVVRTEPDTFAFVRDLRTRIRFHFDERISESASGGTLAELVTVSPRSGDIRVRHGGRAITVEVEGGLRPGVVYRVTLLPGVRDLFGNQLREPFELVFSTGGIPAPTTLAGQVWDRITGRGVQRALVHAVGPDSLVHVAVADELGIFAFRYLPAGSFVVTGFEDVDRDRAPSLRDVRGSVVTSVAAGDTVLVDIPVLPPDTTAAVALRASLLDSLTLVVEFDDPIDPDSPSSGVAVEVTSDSVSAPGVRRVFHEHEYEAFVSAPADSLVENRPRSLGGARGGASGRGPGGVLLPRQRIVALLDAPLAAGEAYTVSVDGVVNIRGLPGGGGEVVLRVEEVSAPPPGADAAVPDDQPPAAPPAPLNDGR
jgi:hypothetical protein